MSDPPLFIVPLFTLYDYTFRPDEVLADEVIAWAAEESSVCADEYLLHPSPCPPTRSAWCAARVVASEARLAALPKNCATVLISHFPLCRAHARLPRVPRFAPWCGTRSTETWPRRFRARAVVYRHLHIRRSFEEHGVQPRGVAGLRKAMGPTSDGRLLSACGSLSRSLPLLGA